MNHRGRIHNGLRRGKVREATPEGATGQNAHTGNEQRRSLQLEPDIEKLVVKTIPGKDNSADMLSKPIPMNMVDG